MVNLTVKKETFQKTLIKLGYSFKIIQYEDFISSIKRQTIKKIKDSIKEDNIDEEMREIFGEFKDEMPLTMLSKRELLKYISKDYLKQIIDENRLAAFLEEDHKVFSKSVQVNAYTYSIVNELINNKIQAMPFLSKKYKSILDKNSYRNNSLLNCINMDGIRLTIEEKGSIYTEIEKNIFEYLINDLDKLEKIKTIFKLGILDNDLELNSEERLKYFIINKYLKDNVSIDRPFKFELFPTKKSNRLETLFKLYDNYRYPTENSKKVIFDIKNNKYNPEEYYLADNIIEHINSELQKEDIVELENEKFKIIINDKRYFFTYQDVIDYIA